MKKLLIILLLLLPANLAAGTFEIPSDRAPDWAGSAGMDPEGGIPTDRTICVTAACNTLSGGTVTTASINSAISSAPDDTNITFPSGTYTGIGVISHKSNVTLKGAGPNRDSTTIQLEDTGKINIGSSSFTCRDSTLGACSQTIDITNEPVSMNTATITLDTGDSDFSSVAVGGFLLIFQDFLSSMNCKGASCADWVGWEPDDVHLIGQWSEVTSVNGGTGVVGIDPPLMFDLETGEDPEVLFQAEGNWIHHAGIEDMKIQHDSDGCLDSSGLINLEEARHSWIDNVELFRSCGTSGGAHLRSDVNGSFRIEVRDSWFHHGMGDNGSGKNYGFLGYGFITSFKFEDNEYTDLRHGIAFEGPSAGHAILYNYFDGVNTDDPGYTGEDCLNNHGVHSIANLWEGNICGQLRSDREFGSASHATFFRNWATGWNTLETPTSGFRTVDIDFWNRKMNFVANVLGTNSEYDPTDNYMNDSSGELNREYAIWQFGGDTNSWGGDDARDTALRQMNFDYVTEGTRTCNQEIEGCQGATSTDTDLSTSLYYASEPSWWQDLSDTDKCRPWPPIGPDLTPMVTDIPAKDRFESETYGGDSCTSGLTAIKK